MRAVIFDMDGVLIDSEPVYLREVSDFFKLYGINIERFDLNKLVGVSYKKFWSFVAELWKEDITPEEMEKLFLRNYKSPSIDYNNIINPHLKNILPIFKENNIRLGIASSSSLKEIYKVCNMCNITNYFDHIVSGELFKESKPNPEIYNYIIDKIGINKSSCIAIEDSTVGIEAAKAAGIKVIAKIDYRFGFDQSKADYLVHDLLEAVDIILGEN